MPQGCQTSCVVRATLHPHFLKSTMMKGIISAQTVAAAKVKYLAYGEWIKKNGHQFKEKKKETKLKHGIEKIGAKHKDQKEPKNEDKDDDE